MLVENMVDKLWICGKPVEKLLTSCGNPVNFLWKALHRVFSIYDPIYVRNSLYSDSRIQSGKAKKP
jgi:hypothetical protein